LQDSEGEQKTDEKEGEQNNTSARGMHTNTAARERHNKNAAREGDQKTAKLHKTDGEGGGEEDNGRGLVQECLEAQGAIGAHHSSAAAEPS